MATVIERFASKSSNTVHEVLESDRDGVCYCSCIGWKVSKNKPKTCKHMMELVKRGVVGADHVRGSTAPAPTPAEEIEKQYAEAAKGGPPQAMLAHPIEKAPYQPWDDPKWAMELKYDGYRLFHVVEAGRSRQFARSGANHTGEHPWLQELTLPDGTVLDGEIAPPGDASDYAGGGGRTDMTYVVFDVLSLGGVDLVPQPFETRRQALEMLVDSLGHPRVRASRMLGTPTEAALQELYDIGAEGVMLKRLAAPYQPGKRTWDMLKVKKTATYDVVIVDAEGECTSEERKAAGWKNLRYGVFIDGKLSLISSLGVTGMPEELAPYIGQVVEVKGWGQNPKTGAVRHPQMIRVRDDKRPEECTIGENA